MLTTTRKTILLILLKHTLENKMKKVGLIVILAAVLTGALLTSCKKHPDNTMVDYNVELQTISEYMYLQQFADQFMQTFFKAVYDSTLISQGFAKIDSAMVNYQNQHDTMRIQVVYWHSEQNDWHHIDSYKHYRMGFFSFLSDSLFLERDTGRVVIEVEKPFYFDSLNVNIQNIDIRKTGINDKGRQQFRVEFRDMVMSGERYHKFTYRFSAAFDYELVRNGATGSLTDEDYLLIKGNIAGNTKTRIGFHFETGTDTLLELVPACRFLRGGKGVLTMEGSNVPQNKSVIDYVASDGCANYYEVDFMNGFKTGGMIEARR